MEKSSEERSNPLVSFRPSEASGGISLSEISPFSRFAPAVEMTMEGLFEVFGGSPDEVEVISLITAKV